MLIKKYLPYYVTISKNRLISVYPHNLYLLSCFVFHLMHLKAFFWIHSLHQIAKGGPWHKNGQEGRNWEHRLENGGNQILSSFRLCNLKTQWRKTGMCWQRTQLDNQLMKFSQYQEFLSCNSTHSNQEISINSPLLMTYVCVFCYLRGCRVNSVLTATDQSIC